MDLKVRGAPKAMAMSSSCELGLPHDGGGASSSVGGAGSV